MGTMDPGFRPGGAAPAVRFRQFSLLVGARTLLRDGAPVALGGRAFDLLHVLLSGRGHVISKTELVSKVWPHCVVEESNLRFQMTSLRRALGDDRDLIRTVTGRGYLFVAEDQGEGAPGDPDEPFTAQPARQGGAPTGDTGTLNEALSRLVQSFLIELQRLAPDGEQRGFAGVALYRSQLALHDREIGL